MSNTLRSPRSLAITAIALSLIAIGVVLLFRPVTPAAAFGLANAGPWHAGGFGPWAAGSGNHGALPAELSGLADVPASERFQHFRGVQVQLTDKDNRPVTVNVTPGTVTSSSATSLTMTGNDGASHTYTLDDKTMQRGSALKQNDHVVVATLNNSATATAVFAFDPSSMGPRGPFGR